MSKSEGRKVRSDREIALEHGRKLLGYLVRVENWTGVKQVTTLLEELSEGNEQVNLNLE